MDSQYTVIPFDKRDSILEDLKDLQAEIDDVFMGIRLDSIIFRLECWSQWDPDFLRLVGEVEAEEEGSVKPKPSEVSDVFTLSV